MRFPPDVQKRLAKEYRFAATKMREESDPFRKVFFFSALFTELSRNLNWYWNRDIVLLHWVLQATHSSLTQRAQPTSAALNMASFGVLLERLTDVAEGLAEYMERGGEAGNLHELIGRIAEIGYLSTPHGSYVIEKGLVKPDSI